MRWSQAWMLIALATLSQELAGQGQVTMGLASRDHMAA
jgi:hypothetical protein